MRNIAIVRRNGLGDLLCTFPLIAYFRKKYPDAALTLFVDERNAPLLPYLPQVEEVVVFPARGNKYFNLFKVALRQRKKRFDLAISTKTSPMKLMNFFLFCLGAKKKVAYINRKWHSLFINGALPFRPKEMHNKHQALKVLNLIDPQLSEVPAEFFPKMHLREEIKQKYVDLLKVEGPILLLSASTTRSSSRFDQQRYAALVNRLYKECGPFSVLLLGQVQDEVRAHALADQLHVPYVLYFPRNFEEFVVLMERSDIYFVGDGGIAHIGAALDKPQVVLFGETRPSVWAPLGLKVQTFYDPIHVNRLCDEKIYEALKQKMNREVMCGRANCDGRMGLNPCESFSATT